MPCLAYPQFGEKFKLYTDASDYSVGAVLCQDQGGRERVIAYAGRSMHGPEKSYGITEKECLGLVYRTKNFDCYLRCSPFEAIADHSALQWLFSMKSPLGKLAQFIMWLQRYDMQIVFHKGKEHGNADAMSRRIYNDTCQLFTRPL